MCFFFQDSGAPKQFFKRASFYSSLLLLQSNAWRTKGIHPPPPPRTKISFEFFEFFWHADVHANQPAPYHFYSYHLQIILTLGITSLTAKRSVRRRQSIQMYTSNISCCSASEAGWTKENWIKCSYSQLWVQFLRASTILWPFCLFLRTNARGEPRCFFWIGLDFFPNVESM